MDPQPPQDSPPRETPPDQPPGAWVPPSPVTASPAVAGRGARPGAVTAAGVVLIVLGVLIALLGILFVLGGSLIGNMGDAPELQDQLEGVPAAFGGILATIGVIVVLYGLGQIVTGIFVLPGRSWARIAGLILAVLGGLLALVGMLPSGQDGVNAGSILVSLVVLAAYAYTAWALATNGRWFASG
jgi:hypothetical protein